MTRFLKFGYNFQYTHKENVTDENPGTSHVQKTERDKMRRKVEDTQRQRCELKRKTIQTFILFYKAHTHTHSSS